MTDDTIRTGAFTIREWVKAHSVPLQTLYYLIRAGETYLIRAGETFHAACGDPAAGARGRSDESRLGRHNRGFEMEREASIALSIDETGEGGARGAPVAPPEPSSDGHRLV